jgi:hypothetical protein
MPGSVVWVGQRYGTTQITHLCRPDDSGQDPSSTAPRNTAGDVRRAAAETMTW